ncbi:MAG: dihydropteroate synthase, partial [Oscillospiraceae bacterium]|nr:dihydropteroate synthase [Oscillospiraceae bacterium]
IIEIGGESSRPGFTPVDAETELARVLPVLEALRGEIDVPIAIDTYKAPVAEATLQKGAAMINNVLCYKHDLPLVKVCAAYNATYCVMHNRADTNYKHFLLDVVAELEEDVIFLTNAGISPQNIILDPGIGFAKSPAQNLEIMRDLALFSALPYPVMLGASRKSFIGHAIGLPVEDRLEATVATTVLAIQQGCAFVRVHDVLENKRAAMMADAIMRGGMHG